MKFINLTRRTEIGANSYYLEIAGHHLVLDCGMHPKNMGEDALPNFKLIAAQPLDAVLISHSHQDHIGTLPVLMRRQPKARVFMSEVTAEIGSTLLHNSVNVMTRQREEFGATLYPLFTHRETDRAADRWHPCRMRQCIAISGERATGRDVDALTFEFFDAGHVLGSSGILLRAEGRTIFYTGDVNFDDQTITEAAIFPDDKIDILIMECTRGDRKFRSFLNSSRRCKSGNRAMTSLGGICRTWRGSPAFCQAQKREAKCIRRAEKLLRLPRLDAFPHRRASRWWVGRDRRAYTP